MRNKKAFSLVEIFVVVIILGVLAAMAIPSYIVGMSRTYARDAMDNLLAIQSAQLTYKQINAAYYSNSDTNDHTSEINSALQLNITPSGGTIYYCNSALTLGCYASRTGAGAFTIELNLTLPIMSTGSNLIDCSNSGPDSTYNPCCLNDGSKTAGAVCP